VQTIPLRCAAHFDQILAGLTTSSVSEVKGGNWIYQTQAWQKRFIVSISMSLSESSNAKQMFHKKAEYVFQLSDNAFSITATGNGFPWAG
jgi:hypothetical protein